MLNLSSSMSYEEVSFLPLDWSCILSDNRLLVDGGFISFYIKCLEMWLILFLYVSCGLDMSKLLRMIGGFSTNDS